MQPLGRKPSRFPTKTDCHPKKGFVNWWEELNTGNKKGYRKKKKQELSKYKKQIL